MTIDATVLVSSSIETRGGVVRVLRGKDAGREATLGRDPLVVGRDPACGLVLRDPAVSAFHVELCATDAGVRLRDLGSKNGTFLGDGRIVEAHLTRASTLRAGNTLIEFSPRKSRIKLAERSHFGALIGGSTSMQLLFDRLERAAATDLTVLLLGETGTGKELAARALHDASPRRKAPFVVVDCGAIPPSLAEASLFGHERGAFTGAEFARPSPFVEANGGTVFLDEIGELPIELQPKLLRILAERRLKPVGGNKYLPVDVRVIAATRRELQREVNEESFRSDLYFRLAQLRIELPPLRERPEDIPLLIQAVVAELGQPDAYERIAAASVERLMRHDWPGNVRELKNAVVAALAFAGDGPIDVAEHLRSGQRSAPSSVLDEFPKPYHDAKRGVLDRFEREYFAQLSRAAEGNIAQMARIAGLERAHVRRYLTRHGLAGTSAVQRYERAADAISTPAKTRKQR